MILDGQFAAYMQVSIQNDGPVTFEIESPDNLLSKERTRKNESQNQEKECNKLKEGFDSINLSN